MSPIFAVEYYEAKCDGCGRDPFEGHDSNAWTSASTTADILNDDDQFARAGLVACYSCIKSYQQLVSDDAWQSVLDENKDALAAFADHLHAKLRELTQ